MGLGHLRASLGELQPQQERSPEIRDRKLFDPYFPKMNERNYWEFCHLPRGWDHRLATNYGPPVWLIGDDRRSLAWCQLRGFWRRR